MRPFLMLVHILNWGVLIPSEDERVSNEYGDCATPFYECIFLIMGFHPSMASR